MMAAGSQKQTLVRADDRISHSGIPASEIPDDVIELGSPEIRRYRRRRPGLCELQPGDSGRPYDPPGPCARLLFGLGLGRYACARR